MKILLIHEHGDTHGSGAVIAVYRLHRALQSAGVESVIACRKRRIDGPDVVELPRSDRIERLLQKATWRIGLNDIHCVSTFKLTSFEPFLAADVVNIHGWHTNYFNYLALPRLSRAKPIVATLHDMWNFTGHCAYSHGCERWRTGCGRCPYLKTFPPVARDATAIEWRLKRAVYRRSRMHVVAPSGAVGRMAGEGLLGVFPIHRIPNPIDTALYRPMDRAAARRELDLPPDRPVILFVSMSLTNHIKGGDLLIEALRRIPEDLRESATLLALGDHGDALAAACAMPTRALGYVRDEARKVAAYSAADVLVLPSRYENQSLVLIESMACGLPAVTFDVGGLGELVQRGVTGWLSPPEDIDDLAAGITAMLRDEALRTRCAAAARTMIEREHALDIHARRYIEVYETAMRERAGC